MDPMSELIGFHSRMRFCALRAYSTREGIGSVVAVLCWPVSHTATHAWEAPTNEAAGPRLVASGEHPAIDQL